MKIMINKPHRGRTNFVDENNVVLGWATDQICCESFGWAIRPTMEDGESMVKPPEDRDEEVIIDLDGWVFDPSFMKGKRNSVFFRLVKGDEVAYIELWNSHNGYYSHGFKMNVQEFDENRILFEGSL